MDDYELKPRLGYIARVFHRVNIDVELGLAGIYL